MVLINRGLLGVGMLAVVTVFLFSCGAKAVKIDTPKAYPKAVLTMNRGVKWYDKGCYEKSIQFFWDAHEQFSALDLPDGVAASFHNIGNADRHLGEIDNAVLFLNYANDIYEQIESHNRQTKVLADMAATYMAADNLTAARDWIEKAERLARRWKINDFSLSLTKGVWLTRKKKFDQAREVLLSTVDRINHDDLIALGTLNAALGHLEMTAGNIETALSYFEIALEADRQSGFYRGMADNLFELGRIYHRKEKPQKSLFYLQRSIKIYALLGLKDRTDQVLPLIESQAQLIGADVALTLNLVKRWLNKEVHHLLCE